LLATNLDGKIVSHVAALLELSLFLCSKPYTHESVSVWITKYIYSKTVFQYAA